MPLLLSYHPTNWTSQISLNYSRAEHLDDGKVEILVEYSDDGITPESLFGNYVIGNGKPIPFEFDN